MQNVPVPTLKPFSTITCCEKCGNGDFDFLPKGGDVSFEPNFLGLAGPQAGPIAVAYPPVGLSIFSIRYCAGGKEPTDPAEQNPLAAFLQTVSSGDPRLLGSTMTPRINICAGIGEEHLHYTCSRCQYEFLMRTKETG